MALQDVSILCPEGFPPDELTALGLFYAGVRARRLRALFGLDPWEVVQRHRYLPHPAYGCVRALADRAAAAGRAGDAGRRFA